MTTYDWTKLPEGWRHVKDERYGDEFLIETIGNGRIVGEYTYRLDMVEHYRKCEGVIQACSIPEPSTPPDTATVTALKPADEYDWSRLSPGWRFEADTRVLRHDEDWFRIATLESDTQPDDVYWQRAYVAARAQLAKCRRDWRDEVRQACEGLVPLLSWYLEPVPHAIIAWEGHKYCSRVRMHSNRTWETVVHTDSTETMLTMSLIIERLKKLGWREA